MSLGQVARYSAGQVMGCPAGQVARGILILVIVNYTKQGILAEDLPSLLRYMYIYIHFGVS